MLSLPSFTDFLAFFAPYICFWGYSLVFVGTMLENSFLLGFFMPGVVIVLLAGYYARSCLNLETVVVLAVLGAFLGDNLDYWLGRLQSPWISRFTIISAYLNKVQPLVKKFGGKVVFLGRFSAYLRGWVALSAGVMRIPYRQFVLYDFASALIWGAAWVTVGYIAGLNEANLARFFKGTEIVFWVAIISLLGWYIYRHSNQWGKIVGAIWSGIREK